MSNQDLIRNKMPIAKMVEKIKLDGIICDNEVDKAGGSF